MKQLIIVRHGEYGSDGHLNDLGRTQINTLVEKLRMFINEVSVLIFTSPTDRACESAKILSIAFNATIEEHKILSSVGLDEELSETLETVMSRKDECEILILVAHEGFINYFLSYFAENEFGTAPRSYPARKGEAWIIDCQQKTLMHITAA